MSSFATLSIMLRRIDYGDDDLIITFFTLDRGKISAIAKSAKKSTKRFAGILELFSVLQVVFTRGRGKGLLILKEAEVKQPFSNIRKDIKKTAYASYWTEMISQWLEEERPQAELFHLFLHVFEKLDSGFSSGEELSILFQMKFLALAGLSPSLSHCSICSIETEHMQKNSIMFDLAKGGLVCEKCSLNSFGKIYLSKGTIKQLLWSGSSDFEKAQRIRYTPVAMDEGLKFLEAFVPYHLGKQPNSLRFLQQIRKAEI
jgi:DNA repair protein RecO (recombination protein O)